MSTTELQANMLEKIATNEHTNVNGAEPSTRGDIGWIWASEIIESQQDKGVFTSLLNAGLVKHNGNDGADACVTLTDDGFVAYKVGAQ